MSAGARSGGNGSKRTGRGSTPGSRTSVATTTGSTARSARTTPPSTPPCTRSAAGATATRTACCDCFEGCPGPRKGLIGPWPHSVPPPSHPGSRDRIPARGAALVGPLAEGHRHRDHGRAGAARVAAGLPCLLRRSSTSSPDAGPQRTSGRRRGWRRGRGAWTATAGCGRPAKRSRPPASGSPSSAR